MANCIQQIDTTGVSVSSSPTLTCDACNSSGYTWTGDAATDAAGIQSMLAAMGFGGSSPTFNITWPNSSDGGVSDEGSPPWMNIEFAGTAAGYDWPLAVLGGVTASSIQAGTIAYTTLYFLYSGGGPWERAPSINSGPWFRDSGHTVASSGYPGSVAATTYAAYISDASGSTPDAPAEAITLSVLDCSAVVTQILNLSATDNITIAAGGTVVIGAPTKTNVLSLSAILGSGATVTMNAASQLVVDATTSGATGVTVVFNDTSTIYVLGNYSISGAFTFNDASGPVTDNSVSILNFGGTILWNSTATLGNTLFGSASAISLDGVTITANKSIVIGDGATEILGVFTVLPQSNAVNVSLAAGGGTSTMTVDTSAITGGGGVPLSRIQTGM